MDAFKPSCFHLNPAVKIKYLSFGRVKYFDHFSENAAKYYYFFWTSEPETTCRLRVLQSFADL